MSNTETLDESWRSFPQFERVFEPDQTEPFLKRVERTCEQLREAMAKGSPRERERAGAAFTAYQRGLALTKELAELRAKQAATSGAAGR